VKIGNLPCAGFLLPDGTVFTDDARGIGWPFSAVRARPRYQVDTDKAGYRGALMGAQGALEGCPNRYIRPATTMLSRPIFPDRALREHFHEINDFSLMWIG
jgi:hypothetical protein